MSLKLHDTRKSIDKVDKEIVKLLDERGKLALDIAKAKNNKNFSSGSIVYVPSREREVLKNITSSKSILGKEALKHIYTEIISACRNLETQTKVSFLGPCATFSHQAAINNFGSCGYFIPAATPLDVLSDVESGRADFGVVPVENSNGGSVNATLDMLVDTKLQICNEVSLKIEQCFLAKDQNVKVLRIYSHSNALDQCRRWVTKHHPHAQLIPVSSTAEAAKKASKENFSAAIASQVAAKIYDLYILQKAIQDSLENFTRFLVIGKVTSAPSGKDKTSLVFVVKNKVGALYEALGIFEKNNVSLTKIEARPTKKKAWEYMFFVDFNGYVKDQNIDKTIKSLESKTIFVKSLGSYPRA